jgi:hypothetical protein
LSFAPPALTPDLPPYSGAPVCRLAKILNFADGTQLGVPRQFPWGRD